MNNDIKHILENLQKTKENQKKAKGTVASWAKELGVQEETVEQEINLWTELGKVSNALDPITASGMNLSQDLLKQSEDLVLYVDTSKTSQTLNSLGTISTAFSGIAMSGASISYPPNQIPQAYINLARLNEQQNQQSDISSRIRKVNPALADEYDNVWTALYSTLKDQTRSPMFLIREVVTHLFHHYAPDNEVRGHHSLNATETITRRHRIEYISSKIDPSLKQTFINQEQAYLDVYGELSKAHNPNGLDPEQTKGYLYQANALIKLLLDSI